MNFSLKIFGYIQSIIYLLMIGSLNWFHVFIKNKLITSSLINVTITCYSYFFYWPIPFEICVFLNIMYHIPRERLIFGHRFLFKKESASNFLSNDILPLPVPPSGRHIEYSIFLDPYLLPQGLPKFFTFILV